MAIRRRLGQLAEDLPFLACQVFTFLGMVLGFVTYFMEEDPELTLTAHVIFSTLAFAVVGLVAGFMVRIPLAWIVRDRPVEKDTATNPTDDQAMTEDELQRKYGYSEGTRIYRQIHEGDGD
ncbi:MAG: hypothetical protein AB7Q37_19035 [Pyrinomonadaceae bacterium]